MKLFMIISSILLTFNSILLFINIIKFIILKNKINLVKYWIYAIDEESLNESMHDKEYLKKSKSILYTI